MGLLDILIGSNGNTEFKRLIQQISDEANSRSRDSYSIFGAYGSLESSKRLAEGTNDYRKGFLFFLLEFLIAGKPKQSSWRDTWHHALKFIQYLLKITELNEIDAIECAQFGQRFRKANPYADDTPDLAIIEAIGRSVRKNGLTPKLRNALLLMQHEFDDYANSAHIKAQEMILFFLQEDLEVEVSEHDRWGQNVVSFIKECTVEERESWIKLFVHAKASAGKSTPSHKWLKEAGPLVEKIGHIKFATKMEEWLALLRVQLQEIHKSKDGRYDFLRTENHEVIKGLIWCCALIAPGTVHTSLDEYAAWAYKKKPGVGPISAKTGTAAMFTFSMLPVREGVSRIAKIKMKIRNNTVLKSIDKIIRDVAEKNNLSTDELEELCVPDFGIHEKEYSMTFGECRGVYNINLNEVRWERNGKIQKNVPAEVKASNASELKTFKNTIKEIDALLPVIKMRLEQSYLAQREWTFKQWKSLYFDHPLTSLIADKLIWHFSNDNHKQQGMFLDDAWVDASGNTIDWLNDDVKVQLWHPIGFSSDEIVGWRNFLTKNQIVQPFKQAYREVYILTDAELRTDTYSNRFAAHVLRQHQFAALTRQRGWHYQLMGNWDSHNTPYVDLIKWKLSAEFLVNAEWNDGPGAVNDMGIFNYITTDQVRFLRQGQAMNLYDVPALVFSEVMRDVDLFVGVTSIGNDPAWQDGGDNFTNTYWREYSFQELSESAKVRSQVLESLIPNLKIAPKCSFDKRCLIVKGKIRTYKIHIGSGNILMEPDDQYLCIVPASAKASKEKVFLPFEGDGLLSIILSKAFMLADDDKITDETIIRQIER
jgi:hypothetical protein